MLEKKQSSDDSQGSKERPKNQQEGRKPMTLHTSDKEKPKLQEELLYSKDRPRKFHCIQ